MALKTGIFYLMDLTFSLDTPDPGLRISAANCLVSRWAKALRHTR